MNAPTQAFEAQLASLRAIISKSKSALVALSGGVDSTLCAAICAEVLNDDAMAVTGISTSLSTQERQEILAFCEKRGLRHEELTTHEMSLEAYQKNNPDRCFHCKNELYGRLRRFADERGIEDVFDGTHIEDLAVHRPSLKAAEAHRIRSPFVEAGIGKNAIRAMAKHLGLENHARPAQPCLSSRIAYGVRVTDERLERVSRAEALLRDLGFVKLRVRLHDEIARVEVPKSELMKVVEESEAIVKALKSFGFVYVTLDLQGMRSGSLLEVFDGAPLMEAS